MATTERREVELKVQYLTNVKHLKFEEDKEWIDVMAGTEVILRKGKTVFVPLGFYITVPEGFEVHISPKNFTYEKLGIVMDKLLIADETTITTMADGQWALAVYCTKNIKLQRDTVFCQMKVVEKVIKVEFKESGGEEPNV